MKIKGFKDTIEWYNKNANQYAQSTQNTGSIEEINEFVALIPKGGRVLDAGCGAGRDTNLLSKNGLRTIGIDLSIGLLGVAKSTYPTSKFFEADFLDTPFSNDYFDGIWAHASLVHLETYEDIDKAIKEFYRIMKKGAVIHILVKAQTGNAKTAVVSDTLSKHDRFFQYFKKSEIKELLIFNHFEIIKLAQYKEVSKRADGRPEVEWILALARKI